MKAATAAKKAKIGISYKYSSALHITYIQIPFAFRARRIYNVVVFFLHTFDFFRWTVNRKIVSINIQK